MRIVLASALLLSASMALANDQVTHSFSASASRGGASRVVIDVPAGDVKIRNSAAGEIRVVGLARRNYDGDNERNKQQRIAAQTLEIYAPLANRLGMWQMKGELEDLSFAYLSTDTYNELTTVLKETKTARDRYLSAIEAKEYGLVDEVLNKPPVEKK